MKIVVTPRTFGKFDPGVYDLLASYGLEADVNDTGTKWPDEVFLEHARDCDGIIFGTEPIDAKLLDACPRIRAVAKYGVGIDNVDADACRSRGVKLSRTVGANAIAVADFAFGMAIDAARHITRYDKSIRTGAWDICTTPDVTGKTIGVIGLGAIGRLVAARARGFSMQIWGYDPYWDEDYAEEAGVRYAEPDEICRNADFIMLHLPLTPQTRGFIDERRIALMKKTAVLINCARGGIVDEDALYHALVHRQIYAAGLDVFVDEPKVDARWYGLDNVLLSPHAAAQTYDATAAMGRMAIENIARDLGLTKS